MKKLLLVSACMMVSLPVCAQRYGDCAYTLLQNLVMNARSAEEIQAPISRGVAFDEQVRCGGSLVQLAIRRGNPDVLQAILQQDQKRASAIVDLSAFPIQNGPKQIPVILFAAYYAPNKEIVQLLMAAGADINVSDDGGRNILWYLDKNPVLKNTALVDEIQKNLLYGMAAPQNAAPAQQQQAAPQQQAGQQQANSQGQPNAKPQHVPAKKNSGLIDES